MIRIYGYYSCGGYKDMYLGNNEGEPQPTYFLPLLPVMEARKSEKDLLEIEKLKELRQIEILTSDKSFGFPGECNYQFSHGGYVSIYRTLSKGSACLTIRDIYGSEKDEEGRSIPFNLMFVADGDPDIERLDMLALSVKDNFNEWYSFLGKLFRYDPIYNGIKFDLPAVIGKILSLETGKALLHHRQAVDYLMIENSESLDIAIREQGLRGATINCVINKNGDILQGEMKVIVHTDDTQDNPTEIIDSGHTTEKVISSESEKRFEASIQEAYKRINELEKTIKKQEEINNDLRIRIDAANAKIEKIKPIVPDDPSDGLFKQFPWLGTLARYKNLLFLILLLIILIISISK